MEARRRIAIPFFAITLSSYSIRFQLSILLPYVSLMFGPRMTVHMHNANSLKLPTTKPSFPAQSLDVGRWFLEPGSFLELGYGKVKYSISDDPVSMNSRSPDFD